MRERDRMEPILAKIMASWEFFPDLRLGQLLLNATALHGKDLYNIEDKELAQIVYDLSKGVGEE